MNAQITKMPSSKAYSKQESLMLDFLFLSEEKLASTFTEYFKENYGWTVAQTRAMCYLKLEGSLPISQLADKVNSSRQHMTYLIDSMVERGLAVRSSDPNNRRNVIVEGTEEGLKMLDTGERRLISHLLHSVYNTENEDPHELIEAISKICRFLNNFDISVQNIPEIER